MGFLEGLNQGANQRGLRNTLLAYLLRKKSLQAKDTQRKFAEQEEIRKLREAETQRIARFREGVGFYKGRKDNPEAWEDFYTSLTPDESTAFNRVTKAIDLSDKYELRNIETKTHKGLIRINKDDVSDYEWVSSTPIRLPGQHYGEDEQGKFVKYLYADGSEITRRVPDDLSTSDAEEENQKIAKNIKSIRDLWFNVEKEYHAAMVTMKKDGIDTDNYNYDPKSGWFTHKKVGTDEEESVDKDKRYIRHPKLIHATDRYNNAYDLEWSHIYNNQLGDEAKELLGTFTSYPDYLIKGQGKIGIKRFFKEWNEGEHPDISQSDIYALSHLLKLKYGFTEQEMMRLQ